jgi:RimJ/RimL family protein N-acetyltransferase
MSGDDIPTDAGTTPWRPMATQLETPRLMLTEFRPDDAPRYAALIAERGPGARGFGTTVDQARTNIHRLAAEAARTGIRFLAVRRRGTTEMIGYCGLLVGRATLDEPEIAYELFQEVHGNGFATEAAAVVVEAAAQTGRHWLWSTVGAWNAASLRVLDKLGFCRHHSEHGEAGEVIHLRRDLVQQRPTLR